MGPALRIPEHVVHRGFGAETVVLNLATGKYHGLNPTAGRMLEVLTEAPDLEAAAVIVAAEFGVPLDRVRDEMREFCDQLADRGLVERGVDSAVSRS
jgi:PqqD family protein of HPr-rel-A system